MLAHADLKPNFAGTLRDILSLAVQRDIDRRVIADLLVHPSPDDPVTPNQQRAEP